MAAAQTQTPDTPVYVLSADGTSLASATLRSPGALVSSVTLTGVTAGQSLVSIDVRPQNQSLYALGVNPDTDTVQLYHLSPQTGAAVAVGPAASLTTDGSTLVDLPATGWDIDFNPAADRLRIVCGALNFRINPNTGSLVDGNNTGFPEPVVVAGTNPDGPINTGTTQVSATAYTNSQPNNGAVTTQYTLDALSDSLFIQNPPNEGRQTEARPITVNGAALDFTAVYGFDIPPGVNASANNTVTAGVGYALLESGGQSILYQINLTSGAAVVVASANGRSFAIRPTLGASIGLNVGGTALLRFSPLTPGTATSVALGTIAAGETMVAIDQRPATGQLYGLGVNDQAETATLYLIDPQLGSVTAVGPQGGISFADADGVPVDFGPASTGWDLDFNPIVDRLRVVSGGLNFRVNPIDGAAVDGDLGGTAGSVANRNTDGSIKGASTSVNATAYTNNFSGTTVATQYTLDAAANTLNLQTPFNSGTQVLQAAVTLGGSPLDFAAPVGLDILGSVAVTTTGTPASGNGYFTASVGGISNVYSLNLTTGEAISLGTTTVPLSSFAILSIPGPAVVITPTVTAVATSSVTLGGTVSVDGGSAVSSRGIVYAPTATQATPAIGGAGVIQVPTTGTTGTFSANVSGLTAGISYSFRAYAITDAGVSYSPVSTFTLPFIVEPVLDTAIVSETFNLDLDLAMGTTVTAKGLPAGLKLDSKTGLITGRLNAPGVYRITFTAKGPGGVTRSFITTLVVESLPRSAVGTFLGYVDPQAGLNANAAGRIDLTTTSNGGYTLKVTQRNKTLSRTGFLTTDSGVTPVIETTLTDGTQINLTLANDDTLTGTATNGANQATVTGWRRTFDKLFYPANQEMGYYSVSLKPGVAEQLNPLIPQGTGYAAVTIGIDGSVKLTGKAADGSALTSTGFIGPDGDILIHVPLYANLGSLSGILALSTDANGDYSENTITGSLSLTKPATAGRTYPAAINLATLEADGQYLARAATGSVVLGLPDNDTALSLIFEGAGIGSTATSPNLNGSVDFSANTLKLTVPKAGTLSNPRSTSVSVNASSGLVTGGFTLQDGTLKRAVKFQGIIVRDSDGDPIAEGYFLLPEIPGIGQSPASTAILSGRVSLRLPVPN